jgi:hypothetical protein
MIKEAESAKANETTPTTFVEDINATLTMLFSRKMLHFWPQLIWTGTSIAYWSGLLTPIMTL